MKYWRASRAGNERAERAKLRAKAQLGSLSEPIFGIFLRAERARTLARLVRDFPLAARPARLDANPADGMPRVVHDYRALNTETVKDHTPLMRQEDILDCMAHALVRGKIDLVCAYYQILMEIADIHKTAFKTLFGMYEWLVMPQGLCNAVATFQRYIN